VNVQDTHCIGSVLPMQDLGRKYDEIFIESTLLGVAEPIQSAPADLTASTTTVGIAPKLLRTQI
jgi:hypothetical protein